MANNYISDNNTKLIKHEHNNNTQSTYKACFFGKWRYITVLAEQENFEPMGTIYVHDHKL